MDAVAPSTLVWSIAAVQAGGVTIAWLARLSRGSLVERSFQWLFLVALAAVGVATMAAMVVGPGYCLGSGATLAVMLLGVVCDFSRPVINEAIGKV